MLSAMQSPKIKGPKIKGPVIAGLVVLVAALITGLAFAGWLNHAPGIFLVLAQNGLAWCF
tara:strand:+ start:967 stop:1146 length:180 start_codon:yes stop_codon:yes gene_type:complete